MLPALQMGPRDNLTTVADSSSSFLPSNEAWANYNEDYFHEIMPRDRVFLDGLLAVNPQPQSPDLLYAPGPIHHTFTS
jgi:hypothetical protein